MAFRKTIYRSIDQLRADLDAWIQTYNEEREHQGRVISFSRHTSFAMVLPLRCEVQGYWTRPLPAILHAPLG